MERASRSELLNTIDSQRDQLQQYKSKLRDVVSAYKSVTKEKEALEASVAALTASGQTDQPVQNNIKDNDERLEGETLDPLGVNAPDPKDDLSSLREQFKTLSLSLTTLTQEKNKIEANFIADKKKMKQEIDDLTSKLLDERKRTSNQAEGFELQTTDLKSRLRTQQLDREKEQTNHALMLKELQTLVAKERGDKEQLLNQLEETKRSWRESEEKWKATPVMSEIYETQIWELQKELKSVREHMKAAELKSNQPSPFMLELQQEMERVKVTHQRQVDQERMKSSDSEMKLQSQAKHSEDRVSSLEEKLSELSQTVGNYERLRYQDQQSISKLRERVTQLDMENSALVHAANLAYGKPEMHDEMNVDKIVDKIMHLREMLITASEKSEAPIEMSTIFVKDLNKTNEDSSVCTQYKVELENVKEEFERYKLRAQSVLKPRNKEKSSTAQTDLLKEQNAELRNKLRMSNLHYQEETAQHQKKADSLSKALLAQEDRMKMEISQLKSAHQTEIGQLELELKKQRQRTLAMLSEKDQEMKKILEMRDLDSSCVGSLDRYHYDAYERDKNDDSNEKESEETRAVNKLLNLPKDAQSESSLLHFTQEKSRMSVEISMLRKQKRELETSVRENYAVAKQKETQLRDEISALIERNAKMERQSHREGANLEYLKNVLLKFLTSTGGEGKKQMMKALMTILQFSPEECHRVHQVHGKGWWTS